MLGVDIQPIVAVSYNNQLSAEQHNNFGIVKKATWLSPIVVVPKKNGKIRVCVNYRKLNAGMVTNAFPLPFMDGVLDAMAGHEIYSFLDGFSGYN